jgi:hypothetical protein
MQSATFSPTSTIGLGWSFVVQKNKERVASMKTIGLIGLVLAFGIMCGVSIPPLFAQSQTDSQERTCFVGEASSAACSGKWIFFAGSAHTLDDVWVVRVDSDTGEVWFKDGNKLRLLDQRE